jgi:DNA polymerase-3 subunit delta
VTAAKRPEIERALARPTADIRLYLLHGADESGSRALGAILAKAMGAEAERVDLSGAMLKADPARLADEAASISLFGGPRHILVEQIGDESLDAVQALIDAPAAGNPVVAISGALRKDSKLLKLATASPAVLAHVSYPLEARDLDRLATELARAEGLRIDPDVAHRLAGASGGDRAVLAREIEKFALFLDAAPDRQATLDREAFDALTADAGEADLSRLVDAVLLGRPAEAEAELARLREGGVEGITLVRTMLPRLHQLAALRAAVDEGNSVDSVMASQGRAIFWKAQAAVTAQLRRWTATALATAIGRLLSAERDIKAPNSAGPVLVDAELLAIGRAAQRMR